MNYQKWTPEKAAGQRIVAGFDGDCWNNDIRYLIEDIQVGGLIFFSKNITTPQDTLELIMCAQECAGSAGTFPLFIACDQEGGEVARLSPPYYTGFDGNPFIKTETDAARFAEITARELIRSGFNMNFAPVMDVAPKGFDSAVKNRVFGHDPSHVARMGQVVIRNLQENRVMACAKHFPGIGRTTLDSHLDRPDLDTGIEELFEFDLPPFYAAIHAKVASVMLSHIRYRGVDPLWPASLSPKIAKDLLRGKMGYDGIVITDDLDMGAIARYYDMAAVIRQIVHSDVDIALICGNLPGLKKKEKGRTIEAAKEAFAKWIRDDPAIQQMNLRTMKRITDIKKRFIVTV